jgi:hypothetical protein
MDLETASAIETLRGDLDRARIDLGDRISAVETSLARKLASTEDVLQAEMWQIRDDVTSGLRAEMRQMGDEIRRDLRGEMRQMRDEVMRHAAVLTESVRDDVRILADGVASVSAGLMAVSAKIDALKR